MDEKRKEKGDWGELRTDAELAFFDCKRWRNLRAGNANADIDSLVLSTRGIFNIDSKIRSGELEFIDNVLHTVYKNGDTYSLDKTLATTVFESKQVEDVLGVEVISIWAVWETKVPTFDKDYLYIDGVYIVEGEKLLSLLNCFENTISRNQISYFSNAIENSFSYFDDNETVKEKTKQKTYQEYPQQGQYVKRNEPIEYEGRKESLFWSKLSIKFIFLNPLNVTLFVIWLLIFILFLLPRLQLADFSPSKIVETVILYAFWFGIGFIGLKKLKI